MSQTAGLLQDGSTAPSVEALQTESDSFEDLGSCIRRVDVRATAGVLLVLLSITVSYHVLILTGVVDYRFVWGGRLKSKDQMYVFETFSLTLNMMMLALVVSRGGFLDLCSCVPPGVLRGFCWALCGVFALNTLGNLLAKSFFEMAVFSPITLLMSVAFARLALAD
mmetsp:Transcript_52026/g.97323  ORF Transcript_52026/g.97323 Transcript_52026/m.97323 type:complete len:166 (+) Transcript_52026:44-541(+)